MKELRRLAEAATIPLTKDNLNQHIKAVAHFHGEASPVVVLGLLNDLDQTNEMNSQLREQNTSLDKACAELEAFNKTLYRISKDGVKRQREKILALEETIQTQKELLRNKEEFFLSILKENAKLEELLKAQRVVLESIAEALPIDKSTIKTCYAINNSHRDSVHNILKE